MRPLARPAAENCELLSRAGTPGLGTTRRGRTFPCKGPMDSLSPAVYAADRGTGRSAASRSRRDELLDGEPSPDDGVVLSSDNGETQDSGRARSFSVGSVCGEVTNPLSWARSCVVTA